VLASGKSIDIVYFSETGGRATIEAEVADDLHVCGGCGADLVYPVEWESAGRAYWEVRLRCPNCEWTGTGIYEQSVVERFDAELDRGTEDLVRDLQSLARANMEEDVERFIRALDEDHLLPSDF